MTTHHPEDELLAGYAAGGLAEAPALLIATHLALCPSCRRQVADYEALGGGLLATLPDETLMADSFERTLGLLDRQPSAKAEPADPSDPRLRLLPQPLRRYVGEAEGGSWRSAIPGLRTLALEAKGAKTWLMELSPGRAIPDHGHRGQEMVLVLSGGYRDGDSVFGPGDVQISGPEKIHRPIADVGEPCLCLVVSEGGFRPRSFLGRLVASLYGY